MEMCLACRQTISYRDNKCELQRCECNDRRWSRPSDVAGEVFAHINITDQLWSIVTIMQKLSDRILDLECKEK